MNLPTLVVCDATEEKRKEIEELVQSQPALTYLTTVLRENAAQEMTEQSAKVVWLELDPEPDKGIALISDWKGLHPEIHFLVSYQTLNADLVKASMHAGAIDFLDSETWKDQLPDVVTRVIAKEKAASAPAPPKKFERFDITADRIPAYNESITKLRHTIEDETPPVAAPDQPNVVPLPQWVVPFIVLSIMALALAMFMSK